MYKSGQFLCTNVHYGFIIPSFRELSVPVELENSIKQKQGDRDPAPACMGPT